MYRNARAAMEQIDVNLIYGGGKTQTTFERIIIVMLLIIT